MINTLYWNSSVLMLVNTFLIHSKQSCFPQSRASFACGIVFVLSCSDAADFVYRLRTLREIASRLREFNILYHLSKQGLLVRPPNNSSTITNRAIYHCVHHLLQSSINKTHDDCLDYDIGSSRNVTSQVIRVKGARNPSIRL